MNMSRRYFLKSTGAVAVYCGISPYNLLAEAGAPSASPATVKSNKTLVVIFLRGGVDGLNLVVPYSDEEYYKLRRSLAIARPGQNNGALDLDGFFGLHPAGDALMPLFQSGHALALQAVGYDRNTRSHFEEQDTWETGMAGNTLHSDGWLNRHLATSEGHGALRAVSIGDSLPRILHGKAPAYAIRGLSDLALPDMRTDEATIKAALEHAYRAIPEAHTGDARDLLSQSGGTTLEGIELLKKLHEQKDTDTAGYPDNHLGRRLREIARLIKAEVGLEVAEVGLGGWDTHNNQGGNQGQFANLVRTLTESIAAFTRDLGSKMDDVLVVTLSDFGRTAAENGTQGTDHGWANAMLMVGGPIQRRSHPKVLTEWPGLSPDQLYQRRDLNHTIDFRDVLAEIVSSHLGNPNLAAVLPQHQFKNVGIFT